jgi:hypothetical protein
VINRAAAELRSRWPQVRFFYLTPVAELRPGGAHLVSADPAVHAC